MKQRRDRKMKKWMEKAAEYGKHHRKLTAYAAAVLVLCLVVAAAAGIVLAAGAGSGPVAVQTEVDTLARTLVGKGVTYEDAVIMDGSAGYQYAAFTGLPSDTYGFSDGIILSSGNATKAFTSYPSYRTRTAHADTSDLTGKAGQYLRQRYVQDFAEENVEDKDYNVNDMAVFAIKVTPATSNLSFQYFFASNDYNSWHVEYRDVFGLWMVQDFGGADEKWTDIAQIPADRLPDGAKSRRVNIYNTCPNPGKNYNRSIPGIYKYNANKIIGYLGCTETLDAEINTLTPGKPVWVVMAVGDAYSVNHDSAVFIKANSIRFAKVSEASITYDANSGIFRSGETKTVKNVRLDSSYTVGGGVDAPVRAGYAFDGWYTAAREGKKIQGSVTAKTDTTYYAHWKPVASTVTVPIKKDGSAMPAGTVVELRQNGATACKLTQSGTSWTADNVLNGIYRVFVNGEDAERSVTVNAVSPGSTFSADEVNYYTVAANVTLDGNPWSGQTVTLSDGTSLTGSGPYTAVQREKTSGNSYTLRVNGKDKGSVTVTAQGTKSITAAYHTIQVTVNDTTAWTDASVTLRKDGVDVHRLAYNSGTKKYERILPADDTAVYSVFVDGRDTGRTVSTGSKTAAVTYYTASVNITGGFSNMPVAITNGTDSYILTGGNTNGTAYTCRHVFDRDGAGYGITVGGTLGTVTSEVTSAAVVNLTYYTVTFKNAGGGTHATQYVLSGKQAQNVSAPVKEGSAFMGWATASGATNADFAFNTAITAGKTLYPVYGAAGIKLGEHIQTGDTSAYTYQLPNLRITGYSSVSAVVLTVTNCSDVTVGSGITQNTALDTEGNGTVILTFGSGTTGAAAEAKLRNITVKVKNAKKNHTIQASVYGDQY